MVLENDFASCVAIASAAVLSSVVDVVKLLSVAVMLVYAK